MKIIKKWVIIGITELTLSLVLFAYAPVYLNSNKPLIGFGMWALIPVMLGTSGIYVGNRLHRAQKNRHLFLSHFPQYSHLGITHFLEISPDKLEENLTIFQETKNDYEWSSLEISPLDFLQSKKKQ